MSDTTGAPQTTEDASSNSSHNMRLAIIGAGVSGLTTAYYLRKRGFENVVVFERENRVGGKICSHLHDGRAYELGAVWAGQDYVVIAELMKELLNKNQFFAPADVTEVLSINVGRTRSYLRCILEDHGVFAVGREMLRFAGIVSKFSRAETFGFAGIPAQFHTDIETFSKENKTENLSELVSSFVTGCGYGYYREVPAMYLMKLFPMLVRGMMKHVLGSKATLNTFPMGWQKLMEEMANFTEVRLGSEVEKIVRSGSDDHPRVTITASGKTETFDRIFLTVGLHQLRNIIDLSPEEQELAEVITDYRYRVALIRARNLPHVTVADHVIREKIGHVATIAHFHRDADIYNVYQLADENMSAEDLNQILREDIEQIGGSVEEIIAEQFWDYFPHVRRENLGGYYERMETFQGTAGTYYLGSLMNFETVETNAKYAKQLVLERF